jgi:hypothetical protein
MSSRLTTPSGLRLKEPLRHAVVADDVDDVVLACADADAGAAVRARPDVVASRAAKPATSRRERCPVGGDDVGRDEDGGLSDTEASTASASAGSVTAGCLVVIRCFGAVW